MQEFQPGDTVNNRYKVLRKLGAGAMGSVYLCQDVVENNVKVALKVLISENLDDQDVWAKGEYEALTRLRHPNLARVFNFGRIGDLQDYFIVSEFIKGIDLFTATEYLNYEEVTDILVQICRALEYIHSQGYVHFDIKPDNILVTRHKTIGIKEGSKVQFKSNDFKTSRSLFAKPHVKLIDFGLAEKITGSFSFAIKGTLNYLAPEILNGSTPDKRADLYSLGVTMFQVVNRDLPFYQDIGGFPNQSRATTRSDLFESNMKKHPEYLRELIMKLLEEDPDDRFQSAKEVTQFINKNSGHTYELETEETRDSYFNAPRLVGRKKEMGVLKRHYEQVFFPHRPASPRNEEGLSEAATEDESVSTGEASLTSVGESRAQLVLLNGEIGSGKSRLLEEFRHFLTLNEFDAYIGNCYEGNQKAYQPIIEILRRVTFAIGLESELFQKFRDPILMLLPELRNKRDLDEKPRGPLSHSDKHYFIERMSQLLIEAAHRDPYVLVVNNLHWIDEASTDLLEKLFDHMLALKRRGEHLKLLVLASQRAEEQSSARIKSLLDRLKAVDFCLEIQVRRLKCGQIREFLQSLLGLTEISEEFVNQLEEQTGGNPLFMVETLKALEDEGILRHQADGWTVKATKYSRVEVPQRIEDLLLKRVNRLEPLKKQVLELLSVLDKPVNPKFLQKFKRFSETPILVILRDLESAGLIQKLFDNGKLHFQIEQPKVREILYSNLDEAERRKYHGEVGAAFEEVFASHQEAILEELAYHYQQSDNTDKALELALRAGERLKAIYANEKAYDYFLYVFEQVAENPEKLDLYFDTEEKLGEICVAMGRYDQAERHYRNLLEEDCRESLPPERVTTLFLRLGKVFEIQGDYDSALKCYKDARNHLSSLDETHQILERPRVYNSIGWVYVCMGKYEKAMTISLEALRVINDSPEQIEHAMIYSTIGNANYHKGNIVEAINYHRQSLEIKENLEHIPEITISLNDLGRAYLAGAEYSEATEHLKRALTTSDEIGDPYGRAITLHNLARLYCKVGDLDKAEEFLEESIRLAKGYNMRHLNLQNYAVRGALCRERKDFSKAEGNLFRVLSAFSKQGNRAGLCKVLLQIAGLHRSRGNMDEARSMVAEARRYAEELRIHSLRSRCLLEHARLLRASEDPDYEGAVAALQEALGLANKSDNPEFPGEVNFELADTLVSQREVVEARQYYKAAEEKYREVLENLPNEFRAVYTARLEERFHGWSPREISTPDKESACPETEPADDSRETVEPRPEDALRRVNELMLALPKTESVSDFLGSFLAEVIAVSRAEYALLLSLSGRNLTVVAARDRAGSRPEQPAALLYLPVIDRCLRQQRPVFLTAGSADAEDWAGTEVGGVSIRSLSILPFLEPDGKKGAIYLINLTLACGSGNHSLLFQPFLNLLPLCYHHFKTPELVE